jgi:Tfp pilus assembly protein FimT
MTDADGSHPSESGYSLTEMMFVLGLLAVVTTMAVAQINVARPGLKGDGAMRILLGQLNQARESAITQRKYVRVVLTEPDKIEIVREDTPTTTTRLSTVWIEGGAHFAKVDGVPDTPEGFALGQSGAIALGSAINVKFSPDGTMVNQDGASANGTAFLAMAGQALSARAVTILGSTGRIRGYKWNGSKWKRV